MLVSIEGFLGLFVGCRFWFMGSVADDVIGTGLLLILDELLMKSCAFWDFID